MTEVNIEKLWMEYYPKVYGYFFRRLNSRLDIEDLTSVTLTVFLNALTNSDKKIQNKNAYLWKIAHNQLLVFIHAKSTKPLPISIDDDNNFVANEVFSDETEDNRSEGLKSRIAKLMQCVKNHLNQNEVFIVEQIVMEDKKATEVAISLNLNADNVRQKLSRSLKKLRRQCTQIWEN
jgi:RNA polymerase sigma factor (sigma-70 family)